LCRRLNQQQYYNYLLKTPSLVSVGVGVGTRVGVGVIVGFKSSTGNLKQQ